MTTPDSDPAGWRPFDGPAAHPWTDDYSDIISVMRWRR